MQTEAPAVVGSTLHGLLEDTIAGESTGFAVERFRALFGNRAGLGIEMAARALREAMPEERARAICLAYTEALYEELALDGSPPDGRRAAGRSPRQGDQG